MSRALFVTATGTEVGKTYVSALILKALRTAGINSGYYKAAQSGSEVDEHGLDITDAAFVAREAGLDEPLSQLVSYRYNTAVSPHLAAMLEGNPAELSIIQRDFQAASQRHDYVLMEGSGGILCPIRYDDEQHLFLTDIISALGLGVLVVASSDVGTINATVLTVEYLQHRAIPLRGIILNNYREDCLAHTNNAQLIEEITGIPIAARIAPGAKHLSTSADKLAALFT